MTSADRRTGSSGPGPEPHEFKPRRDPGLAAFAAGAAGASGVSGGVPPATMTGHYIRESLCDVPGCNRPELDPVHEAKSEA